MTELAYLTATELAQRFAARELSPVEVVQSVLARIEQHEPRLNSFVLVDADRALSAARASEERYRRGAALGPLDGVPVSIKDLLLARGWPTRYGSRTRTQHEEDVRTHHEEDAPAVARLRAAGAVLLGKTTTSEFGLKGMGDSPLTGITRNPWNLAHTPGGSSAGAVVSVAAGFNAIAVGTDGGGSIRVPSSHTGVIGLKPTFGRVPTSPPSFVGVPPHVGPIARSVSDLALALRVLAQPDPRDPAHVPLAPQPVPPLRELRIGYSETLGYASPSEDVLRAVREAVSALRDQGAHIEHADPELSSPAAIIRRLFAARAAWTLRELSEEQRALLDPEVAESAREGAAVSGVEYLQAEAERVQLMQALARYHATYDLLITPVSEEPAPLAEQNALFPGDNTRVRQSYAAPFSLSRQPALSIPCGLSAAGLPIGLQIVGRHYEDATVLALAEVYERIRPFRAPAL